MALSLWQQLRLVLWKNYKIQFRRRFGTFLEIVLPLAFFALIIGLKDLAKTEHFDAQFQERDYGLEEIPWPNATKIVFFPNTGDVANVMMLVERSSNESNPYGTVFEPQASKEDLAYEGLGSMSVVGVQFSGTDGVLGANTTFSLRFPSNPECTGRDGICSDSSSTTWDTEFIYSRKLWRRGPERYDNDFNREPYLYSGFARIQYEVSKAIVSVKSGNTDTNAPIFSTLQSYMQLFPYAEYTQNYFATFGIKMTLPLIVVLGYLYPVLTLVRDMVVEKEQLLKESMKLMGMAPSVYWLGWFIKAFVMHVPVVVVICIMLTATKTIEYVDFFVLLVFFILYLISLIAYAFMVSSIFTSAKVAAIVSGIGFLLLYTPASTMSYRYEDYSTGILAMTCLCVNSCMYWGWVEIGAWEEVVTKMGFSKLFQSSSYGDPLNMGMVLGMLIVDIFLYMFVAFYIENVFPGRYGVSRPWYFLFTSSYWCGRKHSDFAPSNDGQCGEDAGCKDEGNIEKDPIGLEAGVRIMNLTKVYPNGKLSVNGLSLNMYEGQITCLLGHNGAGKSTTMHILTGIYEPTGGTALVNGYDIRTEMVKCRSSLGLCPQVNTLFATLTVEEQLYFFGRLKGISEKAIDWEINTMLADTQLQDKRNQFPSGLSGGMKRKLCVGIALIAGSKVVFLDEPTSGMDPGARRATWDLIVKYRPGRTILLTTHFMDEADILGNRIAIMAEGRVRACGTSLFLKKRFGMGYQLVIAKTKDCNEQSLVAFVQSHIEEARVLSSSGAELALELPDDRSALFQAMFLDLEQKQRPLGIETFGVSSTTMEQVFLKVGQMVEEEDANDSTENVSKKEWKDDGVGSPRDAGLMAPHNPVVVEVGAVEGGYQSEHDQLLDRGPKLTAQHFKALLIKRFLSAKRDWKVAILQLALPVLFTILAMIVARSANPLSTALDGQVPFWMTTDALHRPEIPWVNSVVGGTGVVQTTANSMAEAYGHLPHSQQLPYPTIMVDFLLNDHRKRGIEFLDRTQGAFSLAPLGADRVNASVFISTEGLHSLGIFLNSHMTAVLQVATSDPAASINVVNQPFPKEATKEASQSVMQDVTGFNIAFFLVFGYGFLFGSFTIFTIKERVSKAKHIQLVSGVSPVTYWVSTYVWDIMNSLMPIACIMVVLAAFQVDAYMDGANMGLVFLLLLLFSYAYIPVMYIVSLPFTAPTTGLSVTIIVNLVTGMASLVAVNTLRMLATDNVSLYSPTKIVSSILYIFPNYAFGLGMGDLYLNWQLIETCKLVIRTVIRPDMVPSLVATGVIPQAYADNVEGLCTSTHSNPYTDALTSIPSKDFHFQHSFVAWDSPGIGRSLMALAVEGIAFFALLLLLEYRFFIPHRVAKEMAGASDVDDQDVANERTRILNNNTTEKDVVVLRELTKVYPRRMRKQKPLLAVDHITLGIRSQECFGLLGVNGAGKTTTFSMLTGDFPPTAGSVSINGIDLTRNLGKARRSMGYCPQFDALHDHLTGKETLEMYGRLRGVKPDRLSAVVKDLIDRLGLAAHADRECGTYSGGNKRKLSTAMALVGDPPVILLDEPTTGVDPATRRVVWDLLAALTREGRCVVLTSHSMEECEALCTQLTIMVKGKMRCLGSLQHLKHRFGKGYQVFLKTQDPSRTDDMKLFMHKVFPGSVLKEEHQGLLTYSLPKEGNRWSTIFGEFESAKARLNLVDYSVSQTTLEQVFIRFTQEQQMANDQVVLEEENGPEEVVDTVR